MPPQHFRGLMNSYDSQKRVKKLVRTVRDEDDYVECRSLLRLIDWHEAYAHERLPHLPALKVFLRGLVKKPRRKLNQALRTSIAYRQVCLQRVWVISHTAYVSVRSCGSVGGWGCGRRG